MSKPKPYDHDHENEVQLFARANFRNRSVRFGIKTDDRRKHVYVIGKSGMGKTTLLENMLLSDIHAGHGCCYIDPHGDTAEKLLDYIPSHRINDVVYFNPADTSFPIGFNILESVDPDKKHLVAAGLMAVFKKIWPDVWSARMEYILVNTILALLDVPGATMLGINRLYVDEEYRKRVVSLIQDPVVKTFWVKEFAAFSEKYRTEAVAPVQNKVGQFMSASIIRNIVAQVKSTIDMRDIMDNRKILIVNLSKGLIGEENMHLLGGMIITRLQLAAMERVDIPEPDRQDFYLYVDEFQNFANESFATILSEARKYRLGLVMAHQYIEQLDEKVASAIFGNVGTLISFRVGGPDAEALEKEFAPYFTPEDLIALTKFDIYLRLLIDGVASTPFSATTLAPIAERTGSTDKVIKVSRERYAVPRKSIEENVIKWSGFGTGDSGKDDEPVAEAPAKKEPATKEDGPEEDSFSFGDENIEEKVKELQASSPYVGEMARPADGGGFGQKKKKEVKHEVPCSVCGAMQKLTFDPDWTKPWFCKDHLEVRNTPMARKLPSLAQLTGREVPAKKNGDRGAVSGDGRRETGDRGPRVPSAPAPAKAPPAVTETRPIEMNTGGKDVSLNALKPQSVKRDQAQDGKRPPLGGQGKPRITVSSGGDNAAEELLSAVVPVKKDGDAARHEPLTSPVVERELKAPPVAPDKGGRPERKARRDNDRPRKDNKPRIVVSKGDDNAAEELLSAVVPPLASRGMAPAKQKPVGDSVRDDGPAGGPDVMKTPLTSPVVEREIEPPKKEEPKPAPKSPQPQTPKPPANAPRKDEKKDAGSNETAKKPSPLTSPIGTPPFAKGGAEKEIMPPSESSKIEAPQVPKAGLGKTEIEPAKKPDAPDVSTKGEDLPSVGGFDDTVRPDDGWKPGQVIKF